MKLKPFTRVRPVVSFARIAAVALLAAVAAFPAFPQDAGVDAEAEEESQYPETFRYMGGQKE